MKLVFCPSCGHVSMKSRLERDRCEACGKDATIIRVPYPWQYLAGAVVILLGAVFLLWPQLDGSIPWAPAVASLPLRLAWLFAFLFVGFLLSNWGVKQMKIVAARLGREKFPEGGA